MMPHAGPQGSEEVDPREYFTQQGAPSKRGAGQVRKVCIMKLSHFRGSLQFAMKARPTARVSTTSRISLLAAIASKSRRPASGS